MAAASKHRMGYELMAAANSVGLVMHRFSELVKCSLVMRAT